jgi:hypothetical protein
LKKKTRRLPAWLSHPRVRAPLVFPTAHRPATSTVPLSKQQKQQQTNTFGGFGLSGAGAAAGKDAAAPPAAEDDKPRFTFSFGATTAGAQPSASNPAVAKPRRTLAPSAATRYGGTTSGLGLSFGATGDNAAAADAVPPAGGSLLRSSVAGGGLPPATLRPSTTAAAAAAAAAAGTTTGTGISFGGTSTRPLAAAAGTTTTTTTTLGGGSSTSSFRYGGSTAAAAKPPTTTTTTTTQMQSLQQRAAAVGVASSSQQQQQQQPQYRSGLFSRLSAAATAAAPPSTPPDAVVAPAAANRAQAQQPSSSPAPSNTPTPLASTPLQATGTYLDVLTWRDSGRSGAHFAGGLALLALVAAAAYYPHGVSPLTAAGCLGLLDLAVNFVRFFTPFSDRSRLKWAGSSALAELASAAAGVVRALGAAHDRWLSASDPAATLRAAAFLWASAWVGTLGAPPLALAAGAWVALFTLPWAILTPRRRARALRRTLLRVPLLGPAIALCEMTWACMAGMPRTSRLVGTVVGLAALAATTRSWLQVSAGLFVAACGWRTALAPAEIESIRTAAEPWTQSVRKMGRRLSTAMEDALGAGGGGGAAAAGAYGGGRGAAVGVGGVGAGGSLAARVAAGRSYY